jgi:hypothetical protein
MVCMTFLSLCINIISQRQYFAARCLSSYVGNVFGLHSICALFSFYPQASDVGETHSLVPSTIIHLLKYGKVNFGLLQNVSNKSRLQIDFTNRDYIHEEFRNRLSQGMFVPFSSESFVCLSRT